MSLTYYDRKGGALTLEEWAKLHEDPEYKRVKRSFFPDGVEVSTVWLGTDHNFTRYPGSTGHVPWFFETKILGGEFDGQKIHHPSEDAAVAGHDRIVEKLRSALREKVSNG